MLSNKSTVQFNGTEAQEKELLEMIRELKDEKGNLNQMLKILADGEISIGYIYSFVIREKKAPVMVLHSDDNEKARSVLKEAGITLVDDEEL